MQRIKKSNGVRETLFWAIVTSVLALMPAILPYGGRFITRGDYLEQQIAFLLETRRVLRSLTPGYSFTTFLGTGFMGGYSFYTVGSPFVLPLVLLPESMMLYGISVMAVLKHVVAVLTSYYYLKKMTRDHVVSLAGAIMYAFSSFTVVNAQFYHFTDVIAVFPLMLLALEDAFSGDRHYGALALACCVNALTNYYFFAGSAVVTALYFVFRFFSAEWSPGKNARKVISVVWECALGCLLSGVILVPSAVAMLSFSRASGVNAFDWSRLFSVSDFLERVRSLLMPIESGVVHAYFGDAAKWASVAGYLPVFGLAGTLAFMVKGKSRWLKALLVLLVAMSLYPATNAIFSGGSSVVYTRWWYALVLLLALASVMALRDLSPKAIRIAGTVTLAGCVLLVGVFLLPESLQLGAIRKFVDLRQTDALQPTFRRLSVVLTVIGYAALFLLAGNRARKSRMFIAGLCLVASLNYAGFLYVNDTCLPAGGIVAAGEAGMTTAELADRVLYSVDHAKAGTTYTSRIDHDGSVRNYGPLVNEMSITSFHSLRSGYVSEFVEVAGFGYDETPSVGLDNRLGALRSFLSVREYHSFGGDGMDVPEGFVYSHDIGDVRVYTNENDVPMGFMYDQYLGRWDQPLNEETIGEVMLNAVVLDDETASAYANLLPKAQEILPWREAAQARAAQACTDFAATPAGFTASIDADAAGLLFFSVPFDKAWHAKVDGTQVDITRANLAFMALWVEPGVHEVEFTYKTRGQWLGIGLSAASAVVLLAYCIVAKRKRHTKRASA